MNFSGSHTGVKARQLGELIRILVLRIDDKRREMDALIEIQHIRESEQLEKQAIFDEANRLLLACRTSIQSVCATAVCAGTMPGFVAAQKRLLKSMQAKRKDVKTAVELVAQAKLLVSQALDELCRLRARQQILEDLHKALLQRLCIYRVMLSDTAQDEDYESYKGGKVHINRRLNSDLAALD